MNCKIDHSISGSLPQAICRTCHPELTPTAEERQAAIEKAKSVAQQESAERRRKQEILRTSARLHAMERKPMLSDVDAKVAEALRAKLTRLERGEQPRQRKRQIKSRRKTQP